MTASELINTLATLIEQYGDLDVIADDETAVEVEFNSDDEPPVFVIT